ncbi:hypothetical protein, partial [Endozoicomonas sp.]|uniref:hypothetical protein n=1 Tax=Endozoicomonas sp. TaxID=1892382 RepID=UPI003D9B2740
AASLIRYLHSGGIVMVVMAATVVKRGKVALYCGKLSCATSLSPTENSSEVELSLNLYYRL